MGSSTHGREGNFRLIFGRNEIAALMGVVSEHGCPLRFAEQFFRPSHPSSSLGVPPCPRSSSFAKRASALRAIKLKATPTKQSFGDIGMTKLELGHEEDAALGRAAYVISRRRFFLPPHRR